jgi:hypothetical protein
MCSLSTRSFQFRASGGRSAARWLLLLPVLMVGALFYWTVALGLGALSLAAVSALSVGVPEVRVDQVDVNAADDQTDVQTDDQSATADPADPIIVRLQESVEPEDVNDNPGSEAPAPADDPAAVSPSGPGTTSF